MRRLAKDFLRGLAIVVPAVAALWIAWLPVRFFDELLGTPVPGLGLAITLVAVWAVGVFASNRIGAKLVELFERAISRVPVLELLHHTIKDVVDAFVGDRRRFDRPVVVDLLPGEDVKALGFVTRTKLDGPGLEGRVAVYMPQSYNIAGNLILVPADRVHPLETDPGRVMTLIASGGVTGSEAEEDEPAGAPPAPDPPTPDPPTDGRSGDAEAPGGPRRSG